MLRFHFARMLEREAGTRKGDDLEELHSMRVATRRMRAAWRVFGDGFRHGPSRRYVAELRTVATALGAVRDQDVLLDGLSAYMASLPPEEGVALAPLHEAWQAVRDEAREHLGPAAGWGRVPALRRGLRGVRGDIRRRRPGHARD